jgi:hypothetical protein
MFTENLLLSKLFQPAKQIVWTNRRNCKDFKAETVGFWVK